MFYSSTAFYAIVIFVFIYSIILHEISHGFAAYFLGDITASRAGRLSLNPLRHIDPLGSVILPVVLFFTHSPVLFGWALPVPVNPSMFTRIKNKRVAMALCAAAGPLANITLAFMLCFLIKHTQNPLIYSVGLYGLKINVLLAAFNLLPIPPLDGASIFSLILPDWLYFRYNQFSRFGMLILLIVLFSGLLQYILYPMVELLARFICQ